MTQHGGGEADTGQDDVGATSEDDLRFQRVSDSLKQAFVAMGDPAVPAEDKPRWHQRLIAITNSSKHDLATAERRLQSWWADWDDEVGPRPSPSA